MLQREPEIDREEIQDPSFVPQFDFSPPPRISTVATTTVAVAQASSPPAAKRQKRARFVL